MLRNKLALVVPLLLLCPTTVISSEIGWVSQPVRPGEMLVVLGSDLNNSSCRFQLTSDISNVATDLVPSQPSPYSIKLKLPSTIPMSTYNLTVSNCGPTSSVDVNVPQVLWAQGDRGERASQFGWIRVFGNTLSLGASMFVGQSNEFYKMKTDLTKSLEEAMRRKDFKTVSLIAARLSEFQERDSSLSSQTLLRLTSGAGTFVLKSNTSGTESTWSNAFELEGKILPDRYLIDISNNGGSSWHAMNFFVSSEEPNRRYIDIVKLDTRKPVRVVVSDFGCSGSISCDSTPAVIAAVAKANQIALSGDLSEIFFPRGTYYLTTTDNGIPPLQPNVSMLGEGTDLVSIFFKEQQLRTQTQRFSNAPPSYVSFNGTGPNSVSDLTFYVTMFYNTVIKVDSAHSGFTLTRVRIRANAYHCMNGPFIKGRGDRIANYTWEQVGPVIQIHGSDFNIVDNDIYSSYNAIWTSGPGGRFGHISRNRIWSGGAAHWFDQMKQVIFEYNQMTGVSLMAMGNNIDTYGGGYAQNIFHAHNTFEQVWGNDREIMTTDNLGAYYSGKPTLVSGNTIRLPTKKWIGDGVELGGSVAVLDGPGTGQYRRITYYNRTEGVVKVNEPFCCGVNEDSFLNIGPFRGNFLFHGNRYTDGGAFQLYSYAMNAVVSEMTMVRVGGILSWGRANSGQYTSNLHNQFHNNVIEEGNHVFNYNGSYIYPHGKVVEPFSFGVLASDQFDENLPYTFPLNRFIVFRGNRVLNNGGLVVRGNTADVLAEGTIVTNSSVGSSVGPDSCQYSPNPNVPRNGCALYTENSTILFS